mgnify:FL=1
MADDSQAQINSILEELKNLNHNLVSETGFRDDFVNYKMQENERHEDIRDTLRGLKSDLRYQTEDIDKLKEDVGELKQDFRSMKVDLEPIMELKNFVRSQVIRYSSVMMALVFGAVLGIGQM